MNPATINTSTFTLAGPGGSSVSGSVSLDSTGMVATFTPTNALTGGATYVATITTGAQDQYGNGLAAPKTWSFTTGTQACAGAIAFGPPGCGAGILAASAITNTGASTFITGDVDISPGGSSSVTGLTQANYSGMLHAADTTAAAAQLELTAAHDAAAGAAGGMAIPLEIGGKTYAPGVYTAPAGTEAITGILTLSGQGYLHLPDSDRNDDGSRCPWRASEPSQPDRRRRGSRRVLGDRYRSGDAWNLLNIRRNHNGSHIHHAWHRRGAEWQGAGTDWRSHIGYQSGECTSLSTMIHVR